MGNPTGNIVAATGNALIDGLTQGSAWRLGGESRVITYSLSVNDTGVGGTWTGSNAPLAFAVRYAFHAWSDVANLTFLEIGSGSVFTDSPADIAVTLTGDELSGALDVVALGVFPDPRLARLLRDGLGYAPEEYPDPEGDVFLDNFYPGYLSIARGEAGFSLLLHEIGHALGLKHSGDEGGNDRPTFAELGIEHLDNADYSVMSGNPGSTAASMLHGNPFTPMLLDVLAVQHIYGANMNHATGNDTYLLGDPQTVWDAGGVDTISASGANGPATIFLHEGSFSTAGDRKLAIAYGVTIENAAGSPFDDLIYAGDTNNRLDGGRGADRMEGRGGDDVYIVDNGSDQVIEYPGEGFDRVESSTVTYQLPANVESLRLQPFTAVSGYGNLTDNEIIGNELANNLFGYDGKDFLDGGAGSDVLTGGAGDDTYLLWQDIDTIIEVPGQGNDTVQTYMNDYVLPAYVENLVLMPGAFLNGTGNELANRITGNVGWNTLRGMGGDDVLDGGADRDSDTLIGGDGNDTYIIYGDEDLLIEEASQGIDTVRSPFTYFLSVHFENLVLTGNRDASGFGNDANNLLVGNDGVNQLRGRLGDDTYVVGLHDLALEELGEGIDTVRSSVDFVLPMNLEHLELMGTGGLNGSGNDLDNDVTGNTGNNVLIGRGGRDAIAGGGGDDSLYGGIGSDRLAGGDGNDTIDGGDGLDVARYAGPGSSYKVARLDGELVVYGDDGARDVLRSVELLQFSDGSLEVFRNPRDYTGDGHDDALLRHRNGDLVLWEMNGAGIDESRVLEAGLSPLWQVRPGDFTGDGQTDLLLSYGGSLVLWKIEGGRITQSSTVVNGMSSAWDLTLADFTGDGRSDILLTHQLGSMVLWEMNGEHIVNRTTLKTDFNTAWRITPGDVTGDGKADLVLSHSIGSVVAWEIDGRAIVDSTQLAHGMSPGWNVNVAEFTTDARADILLRHDNGALVLWEMGANGIATSRSAGTAGPSEQSLVIGHYSGDSGADMMVRNGSGDLMLREMSAERILNEVLITQAMSSDWSFI